MLFLQTMLINSKLIMNNLVTSENKKGKITHKETDIGKKKPKKKKKEDLFNKRSQKTCGLLNFAALMLEGELNYSSCIPVLIHEESS